MNIAIFDAVGTYFSAPTLTCILEEFDSIGANVDVYLRLGGEQLHTVCKARALPFPIELSIWRGDIESTLRNWKWYFKYRGGDGNQALKDNKYDLVIGLNPEGAIAAYHYWEKTKTPYVYLSFEMMFKDEMRSKGEQREKDADILAARNASLVISQDEWRSKLFSKENGITAQNIELLPVSPRGGIAPVQNNYLRDKFNIPAAHTIILHAGTFGQFTCADEIIESVMSWPSNSALVVNTHIMPNIPNPFLERLRNLGCEKVYITEGGLSASEYAEMVQSADIGLALYQPTGMSPFGGKNITIMGLSSGKLSTYMRYGIPVLCCGNPELKSYLAEYPFGEYIKSFEQIPIMIQLIQGNRPKYSTAAIRFFNEKLDFDLHWPRIWNSLQISGHCKIR